MANNFEIKNKRRTRVSIFNNYKTVVESKRSQVTVFVIIAILIVASVVAYVLLKDRIVPSVLPREVAPVYNYFLSCIEDETKIAASLMGSQAGYLELPEFEPGSDYMPFSSQLDFLGFGIPYWYYVSGNGIAKERVPSKEKMQVQMADYLEDRIKECSFRDFELQGFVVEAGEPEAEVEIKDREIKVDLEMPLIVSYGETTGRQTSHKLSVSSRLGRFYDIAKKIYEEEEKKLFLENYAVDFLRLYAPVDGSEIGCSPKVWLVEDVREDLVTALEANVPAMKVKGNYYFLGKDGKYFVQDIGEDVGGEGESVNFLYLRDWPMKIEVWPSEEGILLAEPVGLQEGLGVLGFCYVPYHFVYDVAYPVLIQIYDSEEMFQFPIGVVIDKNKPREALDVEGLPNVVPELCQHKLTEMSVYTYDSKLDPLEAQIKFKCFDTTCYIGNTEIFGGDAVLTSEFPQCVNGFILASSEGYKSQKYLISTLRNGTAFIVLDKKYKLNLEVQKAYKKLTEDYAVLTFVKDEETVTVVYPEQQEVELTEGEYEIKVYVYTDSIINLQGSLTEKCVDVPKSGIFGIFGASEKKCFTLEIPDQIVSFAVSGGGTQKHYVTESELQTGNLIINSENFGVPNNVEDLQINYNNVEINQLGVEFG